MVILKELTPKGRHRWRGGDPVSFSLPRHCARIRTKTQSKKKKKKKAGSKLAHKDVEQKLYDA